jgi:hypothetical protein
MSNSFMDRFFGPLSKEYCNYFYIVSIIFAISFVFIIISILYLMVTNIKKFDMSLTISSLSSLISLLAAYLVNRLLYTMCVKTI